MFITESGANAILKLKSLRALRVLMVIAKDSNQFGESNIMLADIAKELKLTHKANVSIAIRELEELNFLAVDSIKNKNIYILNPNFFVTEKPYSDILARFEEVRNKKIEKENSKKMKSIAESIRDFDYDSLESVYVGDTNV